MRLPGHTMEGIVYNLSVHPDASADIKAIKAADRSAAADIVTFLQELGNDQDLLDRLTQNGYSFEGGEWIDNIDVVTFVSQQQSGRNLWRLKLWDLEREGIRYRVIYAFAPLSRTIHVLAVAHRDHFDYEPHHPITRRVVAVYDAL